MIKEWRKNKKEKCLKKPGIKKEEGNDSEGKKKYKKMKR